MAVIEVKKLTKDYGSGRGVFDVSFNIERGEVFGFLGPNGAGKTTTIRHLMGFSNPQKGKTFVDGMRSDRQAAKIMQKVGYLPGEIALPEGLTGMEFIRMMQGLRKINNEKHIQTLLERFQLDPRGKTKKMSLGNKRKLAVVTAFMADPEILILDEPTSGLDPVMQEAFIDFMREEKRRGKTILLSSHIFNEVDAICDRISIIKDGKIVSSVNVDEIHHNKNKTYQIVFADVKDLREFAVGGQFQISETNEQMHMVEIKTADSQINQLVDELAPRNVVSFKEITFTLESYFMHFYEKGA